MERSIAVSNHCLWESHSETESVLLCNSQKLAHAMPWLQAKHCDGESTPVSLDEGQRCLNTWIRFPHFEKKHLPSLEQGL